MPGDKIDPSGRLTRQDYRSLQDRAVPAAVKGPPIPDLQMPPAPPKAAKPQTERLVSVTVTDDVPLRDVLIELAREAEVNLELDPRIQGGIIFSAHDQPFSTVLTRICDMAGLRYAETDEFLRIELDTPTTETYKLDYPSLTRRTESDVSIATNVFDNDVANGAGSSGKSGQSSDNNSLARIHAVAEADFWSEVEKNLTSLLASNAAPRPLMGGESEKKDSDKPNFTLNRQAGLVTVTGTSKQHKTVSDYLTKLRQSSQAQVLIEARIVEVELNDQFKSGINWRSLFGGAFNMAARFGPVAAGAPFVTAATATDGVFTASLDQADISTILNLVRTFGTTRILSAPRLTVLNNQTAVLKVARNEVYFTTSAQFPTTVSSGGVPISGTPVFTSTPRTVPVGLVMTVQPSIDQEQDKIIMTLRPTISRIVDRVKDPSIGLNAAQVKVAAPVESLVPVLAVREMDSVLRMASGEVAVMGGLMQDSSENSESGVPPLDEVPVLGNLAKSRDNNGKVTELVILLRAVIAPSAAPDATDSDLYQRFGRDPRPLPMPVGAAQVEPLPSGQEAADTEGESINGQKVIWEH